jgi:hypothetical protein
MSVSRSTSSMAGSVRSSRSRVRGEMEVKYRWKKMVCSIAAERQLRSHRDLGEWEADSGGRGTVHSQSTGVGGKTYPSRHPSHRSGPQRSPGCTRGVGVAPCWHVRARKRSRGCKKTPLRAARRLCSSASQQARVGSGSITATGHEIGPMCVLFLGWVG